MRSTSGKRAAFAGAVCDLGAANFFTSAAAVSGSTRLQHYRSNVTLSKAPSLSKTSSLRNTLKQGRSQHSASRQQETSGCSVDRSLGKGADTSMLSRGASKSSRKGLGARKRSDCPLRAIGNR